MPPAYMALNPYTGPSFILRKKPASGQSLFRVRVITGYNRLCSCNQPLSFQHSEFFPYWIFPTDIRHAFISPIFSKRSFEHTQQAAPILCSTLQLYSISLSQHLYLGTSLVVQWSRIHLPMQGTSIWSPVWDDATCFEAAKPTCHNDRTQVLQLAKVTYPRAWARQPEKPPQ